MLIYEIDKKLLQNYANPLAFLKTDYSFYMVANIID